MFSFEANANGFEEDQTKHLCIFSASTFMAPYLHQFSAVVQIMHFFGAILYQFSEQH